MTTTNTAKIVIDTSQATRALDTLHNGLDKTTGMFGRMKTMILGVGFAAFAKSAINAAGELKDLAESTGFAIDSLARLKVALNTTGGAADKLPQLVTTFSKKLDEARQGSLKAQNQFAELGFTMKDLSELSTEEALQKSLIGIDKLGVGARRTAVQLDFFGKSALTLSTGELADAWGKSAAEGQKYADSIKKAGELNDKLAKATDNLKLAFIQAFEPAIDMINKFADSTEKGSSQLDKMVIGIKLVGSVLVSVFSVGILLGFVKTIGTIGRGIGAIGGALGTAGIASWAASAFRAMGPLLTGLRAVAVILSAGLGVYTASKLFDDFGDIASNAIARVIEGLGDLAGDILNLPTDALAGFLNLFGAGIKDAYGLGTGVKGLVANARAAREEYEKTTKAQKDAKEAAKAAVSDKNGDKPIAVPVDLTEINKAMAAAREMGNEYAKNNEKIKNQITLDTVLIGKGQEEQDLIKAKVDLYQRQADEIDKLKKAKENLGIEEKKAGVGAEYDRQIEKVKQLTIEEEKTLDVIIKQQQAKQRVTDLIKFQVEQQIAAQDKVRQITSDTAQLTMGTLAKAYKEIEDSAENIYQSKLAEARIANKTLTTEETMKIRDAAYAGVEAQKAAKKEYYETSRSFSTGWSQAFDEYIENATNAAQQAKDIFQTATKGMEDMIINFAKTGKLEFKSLIQSIVEQMMRQDIQKAMAGIFSLSGAGSKGGGNIFSTIGSMLGFANGGMIPTNGPVLVGERGPEILSGAGGRTVTPNNQLGGGATYVTYQINATDARSFQQMLAQQPELIHALVQKQQRSLPGGR